MSGCLIDLYFLPAPAYFSQIIHSSEIWLEAHDNFVKQSYRNRTHILTANGVHAINVPVLKSASKQPYKEVKIDYTTPWIKKNHTALQSAYASSPYFDDYYFFLDKIFNEKPIFLYDLNLSLVRFCLKVLHSEKILHQTNSFHITYEDVQDRREVGNKKRKSPFDWLPNDTKSYQQVFGKEFVGNLSILDLIFCEGPLSANFL